MSSSTVSICVLSGADFFAELSSAEGVVCPVPHPARASQFTTAEGIQSWSYTCIFSKEVDATQGRILTMNSLTLTEPLRFESFEPSGLSRRGKCANCGAGRLRHA